MTLLESYECPARAYPFFLEGDSEFVDVNL
jgi:hypothetical protein